MRSNPPETTSTTSKTKTNVYYDHAFTLTDNQIKNILEAVKSKEPTIIRFSIVVTFWYFGI